MGRQDALDLRPDLLGIGLRHESDPDPGGRVAVDVDLGRGHAGDRQQLVSQALRHHRGSFGIGDPHGVADTRSGHSE